MGAGAVGHVYGAAMAKAGASVAWYVRERHVPELEAGWTVRRVRRLRGEDVHVVSAPELLTTPAQVAQQRWDQVWLCVPSNAVHEPDVEAMLLATGDATIVSLTPGPDDRERLVEIVGADRLVEGLIPILAWVEHEPLATVWYVPPLSSFLFAGPATEPVVRLMRAGGLAGKAVADLRAVAPWGVAFTSSLVAELQTAGWSFRAFDRNHQRRYRQAFDELCGIIAAQHGRSVPLPVRLLGRIVTRTGLRVADVIMPLDLQWFLQQHFTKVGAQTTRTLRVYVDSAVTLGLPAPRAVVALLEKREALEPA